MTVENMYQSYLRWLDGAEARSPDRIFQYSVGDLDVFEDQSRVVNRLFYVVPCAEEGRQRYFTFFEENLFQKDARGDLHLVRSEYFLQ